MSKKFLAALPTLAGLAGVSVFAFGAWLAYPPAGFMAGGALLTAGVVLHSRGGHS